ncbi:MAG: N-acetyltransferase [Alphaproteobacteria bacterium]|nr:N-acetyltransferase [Alphaproteobacteria bacterium]
MPDGERAIELRLVERIADVPAAEWDACAGSGNPFVGHAFLGALEDSKSVGKNTGWIPRHLVAQGADSRVLGVVPLYLKSHSYGEYVFDHGWAEAYERAGGQYYPKLQAAVPFTPVPGPRLLAKPGETEGAVRAALAEGLAEVTRRMDVSSLHVTFCQEDEAVLLEAAGFLLREGTQFHWHNHGYASFDDFLATLVSRKRKQLRKERRDALSTGIAVKCLSGAELTRDVWDAFFDFYISTSDRKWGSPYLNRAFFDLLGQRLGDKVALVMAAKDGRWIAGALNLRGADALYGRNWGCRGDWPMLHFECCYYQAIDYAIEHRLARVEAGAQGPHKIQRGYLPVATWSAHWIADPRLRSAIADYLKRERAAVRRERMALATHSPYRQAGGNEDGGNAEA